jgi:uncharacterized protein YndB with AHSA1/START domain
VEPLVVEFTVEKPVERAFDIWVNRPSLWWPKSHTVNKGDDLAIVFESHPGGRIYERTREGVESDWGKVESWEPPNRVVYSWHLFFDPAEATTVAVTFTETDSGTLVRIEHGGWERLGEATGTQRRTNTNRAWVAVTPFYIDACREE